MYANSMLMLQMKAAINCLFLSSFFLRKQLALWGWCMVTISFDPGKLRNCVCCVGLLSPMFSNVLWKLTLSLCFIYIYIFNRASNLPSFSSLSIYHHRVQGQCILFNCREEKWNYATIASPLIIFMQLWRHNTAQTEQKECVLVEKTQPCTQIIIVSTFNALHAVFLCSREQ